MIYIGLLSLAGRKMKEGALARKRSDLGLCFPAVQAAIEGRHGVPGRSHLPSAEANVIDPGKFGLPSELGELFPDLSGGAAPGQKAVVL